MITVTVCAAARQALELSPELRQLEELIDVPDVGPIVAKALRDFFFLPGTFRW